MKSIIVLLAMVALAAATEVSHSDFQIYGEFAVYDEASVFFPQDSIPVGEAFIEYLDIYFGDSSNTPRLRIHEAENYYPTGLELYSFNNYDVESNQVNHIVFPEPVHVTTDFCVVIEERYGNFPLIGYSEEAGPSYSFYKDQGWVRFDGYEFAVAVGFCGNPAAFEQNTWAGIKSSF